MCLLERYVLFIHLWIENFLLKPDVHHAVPDEVVIEKGAYEQSCVHLTL